MAPKSVLRGLCAALIICAPGAGASARNIQGGGGPLTLEDIVGLREIDGFGVSPDGRWLAYGIREATDDLTDYGVRWYVAPTSGQGPTRALALPEGRPIPAYAGGLRTGYIPAVAILWSPDSRRFAFRRRAGDRIELWTGTAAGSAQRVSPGEQQVDRFGWTAGNRLVYRTGLDVGAFQALSTEEAKHGWLLDDRMTLWAARTPSPLPPNCATRPLAPGCAVATWAVDEGGSRLATPVEAVALAPVARAVSAQGVDVAAVGSDPKAVAWTQILDPRDAAIHQPQRRVWASRGTAVGCPAADCVGQFIGALGWARNDRSVWILKRAGDSADPARIDRMLLIEWRPGTGRVRRILDTSDALSDCQAVDAILFCRRSAALEPSTIVAIRLDNGRRTTLVDPNPEFRRKALPRVRRIGLTDPEGNLGFAQLVYPNGYAPGRPYPAVVVQYRARGFLKGGVGAEYPELPIAAQGFFVLSIDMPNDVRAMGSLSLAQLTRRERAGRRLQGNVAAAVSRALDGLVAEGLIDPHRICLTGLSYGAEIVHYALQHTDRYACALASQAAIDLTYMAQYPDTLDRKTWMEGFGERSLIAAAGGVVAETAWSQQPQNLRTPLLMNIGQDEALLGFEGIRVLQAENRPIEVRVFPDEGHIKYRPSHRLGVYENSVRWLRFWLQDAEDPAPELREQYARWRKMRARVAELRASASP